MITIRVAFRIETSSMAQRLIVSINPMPREGQAVQFLRERIEKIPGVRSVSIHAQTEMAYVIYDASITSADVIVSAINDSTLSQRSKSEADGRGKPND